MDAPAKTAICARDDVFAANQLRITHDSIGYDLWMLDDVGGVANHARNEQLAVRQLRVLPHAPFVLMPDVAGLYRVRTGIYA